MNTRTRNAAQKYDSVFRTFTDSPGVTGTEDMARIYAAVEFLIVLYWSKINNGDKWRTQAKRYDNPSFNICFGENMDIYTEN